MSFIKHRIARSLLAVLFAGCAFAVAAATPTSAHQADNSRQPISAVQLFPMNVASLDNAAAELRRLAEDAEKGYAAGEIDSLLIVGGASPEGPKALNRRLAQERAENVARFLMETTSIPAEKITVMSKIADWSDVSDFADKMNGGYAPLVVAAIKKNPANPTATLRQLEKGHVWKWLSQEVFPSLRSTDVMAILTPLPVSTTESTVAPEAMETEEITEVQSPTIEEWKETETVVTMPAEDGWQRGFYIKTNLPAWLALLTNVGVEVDLAPHWSFNLPFYYSGFNYFTSTLKFRTLGIQPEVRWWHSPRNHGFFAGAHFSMAYYNLAFNRTFRYQDRDGRTPALGGGVALGWRFRLNSDPNLTMEASIGAGAYRMHYDVFYNRPGGLLYDTRKRTYIGLDQASLSLTYRFGIGKRSETKGGER
ncbi:MAG: DUF3575 domain-containing protein [Muribaculaceae bacterium]|nr:DUF3575 domain-containing protein [Muribaculaceae bacterium]